MSAPLKVVGELPEASERTTVFDSESWPIAAKMSFPNRYRGLPLNEAPTRVWESHVRQVAAMGYSWIDPIDDWVQIADLPQDRFEDFKAMLARNQMKVSAVSCGRRSPVDVECGEANVAMMHRMLDRAAELGATVLNIGFMQAFTPAQEEAEWFWLADGHRDDPQLRDLALQRVRDVADHALRNGMEISLEMYEDTFIGTAAGAVSFVEDCGTQGLGLNPDIGNIVRLHRPIEKWQDIFEKVLPYANFWHIKNYLRTHDPATGAYFTHPAPLAYGVIDYRWAIRRALELGYRGTFQTEHYGGDWLGVGAENARFIRSVLRGAQELIVGNTESAEQALDPEPRAPSTAAG